MLLLTPALFVLIVVATIGGDAKSLAERQQQVTVNITFTNTTADNGGAAEAKGEGGFYTVGESLAALRGFCKTMQGIMDSLEVYPLNMVGNIFFNLTVPIPNVKYLDRLHVLEGLNYVFLRMQDLLNGVMSRFGGADRTAAQKPKSRQATPPTTTTTTASPFATPVLTTQGHSPSFFLTLREFTDLIEATACLSLDSIETLLTKSPIHVFQLHRMPVPIPDHKYQANLLKAFDIYDIRGLLSRVLGWRATVKELTALGPDADIYY